MGTQNTRGGGEAYVHMALSTVVFAANDSRDGEQRYPEADDDAPCSRQHVTPSHH